MSDNDLKICHLDIPKPENKAELIVNNQIDMKLLRVVCLIVAAVVSTDSSKSSSQLTLGEECARECIQDEARICYFQFTLELYNVLGGACLLNPQNGTSHSQCIAADGVERSVMSVNRMLPGPKIEVCEGDKVVVDVDNKMEGQAVTIHWHGVHQEGTPFSDGVPFVTQCPIQQGNKFRYQWTASPAGTHMWHAHTGLHMMDGIYGSLIIRRPLSKDPNGHAYDEDTTSHVVLLSDWLHRYAGEIFPGRVIQNKGHNPEGVLINGKGQTVDPMTGQVTNTSLESFHARQGRRYRFRVIGASTTVCPLQLTVEQHKLTVIASDGADVLPLEVDSITLFSGERYDFVLEAGQPVSSYWIQVKALGDCQMLKVQQLAVLKYEGAADIPPSKPPSYDVGLPSGVVLNPLNADCSGNASHICVDQLQNAAPVDPGIIQDEPDLKFYLPFGFFVYDMEHLFQDNSYESFIVSATGQHLKSYMDNISFMPPSVPPLSQPEDILPGQICNATSRPPDCGVECACAQVLDIPLNSVVELLLIDQFQAPTVNHPFHIHGNYFHVLGFESWPAGTIDLEKVMDWDRRGLLHRNLDQPPQKDSIGVPYNGYSIVRFRANNPGFWLFHCHVLFHVVNGMSVLFHVGTQMDLPPVPDNFPRCGDYLPDIEH